MAELRTLITHSGVYICPYWRGKEPYRLGDANNTSFSDIWQGERRRKVVENTNPIEKCQFHCLRHESNIEVLKMVQEGREKIETVPEYDRFI